MLKLKFQDCRPLGVAISNDFRYRFMYFRSEADRDKALQYHGKSFAQIKVGVTPLPDNVPVENTTFFKKPGADGSSNEDASTSFFTYAVPDGPLPYCVITYLKNDVDEAAVVDYFKDCNPIALEMFRDDCTFRSKTYGHMFFRNDARC